MPRSLLFWNGSIQAIDRTSVLVGVEASFSVIEPPPRTYFLETELLNLPVKFVVVTEFIEDEINIFLFRLHFEVFR